MTFPNFRFFGNVLRYQVTFLPKTKMVRVVHMNIFYRMDLEICDLKNDFWAKLTIEVFKNMKKQCWGPQLSFEFVSKAKMTFVQVKLQSSTM